LPATLCRGTLTYHTRKSLQGDSSLILAVEVGVNGLAPQALLKRLCVHSNGRSVRSCRVSAGCLMIAWRGHCIASRSASATFRCPVLSQRCLTLGNVFHVAFCATVPHTFFEYSKLTMYGPVRSEVKDKILKRIQYHVFIETHLAKLQKYMVKMPKLKYDFLEVAEFFKTELIFSSGKFEN
jgi:hypothetical protein